MYKTLFNTVARRLPTSAARRPFSSAFKRTVAATRPFALPLAAATVFGVGASLAFTEASPEAKRKKKKTEEDWDEKKINHEDCTLCANRKDLTESYQRLIDGNRVFSENKKKEDPEFFVNLAKGQKPEYLWIGCADSRVPANEITNTKSGQIFVHRNVANLVINTDANLFSVLYYAVEVLKVKHIVVCGHYGCGGVMGAMTNTDLVDSSLNNWLRNIKDVYNIHREELEAIDDVTARQNRLVELNVIKQVHNLAKTKIVQKAWKERELQLHGWVYGLNDGLITDLTVSIDAVDSVPPIFRYDL